MTQAVGGDQPGVGQRGDQRAPLRRTASAGRRGRARRAWAPGRRARPGTPRRTPPSGRRRTPPGAGRRPAGSGGRSRAPAGTGRRAAPPSTIGASSTRRWVASQPNRSVRYVEIAPSEWATTASAGPNLANDRVERLAELHAVGTPRAGRPGSESPCAGASNSDDPEARRRAAARRTRRAGSPGRPTRGRGRPRAGAPDVAADRRPRGLDLERLAARGQRVGGSRGGTVNQMSRAMRPASPGATRSAERNSARRPSVPETNDRAFLEARDMIDSWLGGG